MLKICIHISCVFFLLLNFQPTLSAQNCLKGDCKGGFGVQRIGTGSSFSYLIGNFNKKGKLEGNAVLMSWNYKSLGNEVDFLFALSQSIPPVEKLWDFKPSFIKTGNFVNGLLEGPGIMFIEQADYFTTLTWIADNWFKKRSIKYLKYEGNFVNSNIQPAGVVTFMYPGDTLICASDNLFQDNIYKTEEMVIDIRRSNPSYNQLIRANFVNKKMHGWAVKSERKSGSNQPSFFRQLWCYGQLIHEDNGGAYPFDMDNPQTIKDEQGREITGPLRNGKINGFGNIKYGYNNHYRGYIKDNLPDGFGYMDTIGATKYGMFRNGSFEQGTWMNYWYNRFVVTEGKKDNFKEGNLKESTYESLEDYLAGKQPRWSYEGYMIQATGWQGKVVSTDYNSKTETWYDKGKIVSSASSINNISVWQVYAKDGMASVVVSYDPYGGEGTLADGRKINASNKHEYKPSKYYVGSFYGVCPCGGDAKTTKTTEVSGYTNTWTRTEQVNKSAVVGYWQGTQQVTSTYYTPGYTMTTKVACSNPDAVWAPYGVGTRHSVLTVKSLKE